MLTHVNCIEILFIRPYARNPGFDSDQTIICRHGPVFGLQFPLLTGCRIVKQFNYTTLIPLVFCMAALTGCATKGDIESLRREISALQDTTNEALENSNEARNMASTSLAELDKVKRDAAAARASAEASEAKLDKVFEKSMLK